MKTNTLNKTAMGLSVGGLATLTANATTLVTDNLFDLATKVKQEGSSATVVAAIPDGTGYTEEDTGTSGITWTNTVTGFTQARVAAAIPLSLGQVTVADAQFAPYVELDGTSLTFGREITAEVLTDIIPLGSHLDDALSAVVGASPLQTWSSSAEVGANLVSGQSYQVSVDITTGAGLPLDLKDSSTIALSQIGTEGLENQSFTTVNLVDLITLGDDQTRTATFAFEATENMSEIGIDFAASTLADVNALGGEEGNENFLTFSNLAITPVPEPSTSLLAISAAGLLMGSRRRPTQKG